MSRAARDTCLCFTLDAAGGRVLLIKKKRGMGAGKWNGPGGKLEPGESAAAAAGRETREETGVTPVAPRYAGLLEFRFAEGSACWDNLCRVYRADAHEGSLGPENDECAPGWVSVAEIPYDAMWEDDRSWLPLLLDGRPFHRVYRFGAGDALLGELIRDPVTHDGLPAAD
ncbi:MAG: 8-oxo-dGTP diphosphatase [Elusimicrobia bacterium]|nr:8-oxo-dGTP diphosphatase [Elusimicrobiota bacterium]